MYRFFVEENYREVMTISGGDAHHIKNVLRLVKGDVLQIVTDDGVVVNGEIEQVGERTVTVRCLEVVAESHEPLVDITLAQGLAKGEKIDFVVQKAVELGVNLIIPVQMEHSVLRLEGDRAVKKTERWQKIAQAAAQQAKRDCVPDVSAVTKLQDLLNGSKDYDLILLAYEGELHTTLKSVLRERFYKRILLIIGPEGGLSPEEVSLALRFGARTVSLGRRILRTETAGLAAVASIIYEYEG